MKSKIHIYTFIIGLILMYSCQEITDFDLQENPNELAPSDANPEFVLNEIQIKFVEMLYEVELTVGALVRYQAMEGNYQDAAPIGILNGVWRDYYEIRENQKVLAEANGDNEQFLFHSAMARIIVGYATTVMVDLIGDIPYSQANNFEEHINPGVDDGASIYEAVLVDLEQAISDLTIQDPSVEVLPSAPENDVFYEGNHDNWVRLANTLILRMHIQMRLINEDRTRAVVQEVIDQERTVLENNSHSFAMPYGTEIVEPDSRHPSFLNDGYDRGDAGVYVGNYFIWLLKDSKPFKDPRLRYYLYRPTDVEIPQSLLASCDGLFDWCYLGDFYLGRDHGNDAASPNDRRIRTRQGVYPIGGAFDDDSGLSAPETVNLGGAGILPIVMNSYVDFLLAEAQLTLLDDPDAAYTSLENGIRESMDYVLSFTDVESPLATTDEDVEEYIDSINEEYTATTTDSQKLDIIMREYYITTFGNAMEAYNFYRRTGFPSNFQAPVKSQNIPFPRSFFYPEVAVNSNTNISQKTGITTPVFWDNNPDNLLK
jgi:hypothetical protein